MATSGDAEAFGPLVAVQARRRGLADVGVVPTVANGLSRVAA